MRKHLLLKPQFYIYFCKNLNLNTIIDRLNDGWYRFANCD